MALRLPKESRLHRRADIDELFQSGESISVYPLRCTFVIAPKRAVMVVAPKKLFKRATDRNLLKRRIRESYRLNQAILADAHIELHISLIYTAREKLPYKKIEDATKELLRRLAARFAPCDANCESSADLSADSSC